MSEKSSTEPTLLEIAQAAYHQPNQSFRQAMENVVRMVIAAHESRRPAVTADDAKHLRWLYDRLRFVHKEKTPAIKTGIELIAEERTRQVSVEGWTPEHDDQHTRGELAQAAACYADYAATTAEVGESATRFLAPPKKWPWERSWWKPSVQLRTLVKAGALIAAEIDRVLRAQRQPASAVSSAEVQEGIQLPPPASATVQEGCITCPSCRGSGEAGGGFGIEGVKFPRDELPQPHPEHAEALGGAQVGTPRTDAVCDLGCFGRAEATEWRYAVCADFARQLERDLTTTQAKLAAATIERDEWREMANRLASELELYSKYGGDRSAEESMKAYAALVKKEGGL